MLGLLVCAAVYLASGILLYRATKEDNLVRKVYRLDFVDWVIVMFPLFNSFVLLILTISNIEQKHGDNK
jgi:hypothetical protein